MTARFAQCERRVAPAVQEQHCLLAGGERLRECRHERRREEALPLRPGAAHIDNADLRLLCRAVPRRQMQPLVAMLLDIDRGLKRRRCRDQRDRHLADELTDTTPAHDALDAVRLRDRLQAALEHGEERPFVTGMDHSLWLCAALAVVGAVAAAAALPGRRGAAVAERAGSGHERVASR